MVYRVGFDDHRQVCLPTSETLASAKSPNCLKLTSKASSTVPVPHLRRQALRPPVRDPAPAPLLSRQSRVASSMPPPPAVVFGWQSVLLGASPLSPDVPRDHGPGGRRSGAFALSVGFARLPVGAPAAAIVIEELAALGVKTIVGVGTAGGLSPDLEVGQAVVCSAAIRDEGTSHHYVPPGRWALPDSAAARLPTRRPSLHAVVGPSWTTDAPYRETAEEIAAYRAERAS